MSFALSKATFKVSADALHGTGFGQYPGAVKSGGGSKPLAIAVIRSAELTNMCLSTRVHTPLGPMTLQIHAGQDGQPAVAQDLAVDDSVISGQAEFSNMQIGRDASTLSQIGMPGAPGSSGSRPRRSTSRTSGRSATRSPRARSGCRDCTWNCWRRT